MKNNRLGKIEISALNVPPEKHEYETARYVAKRGLDVIFVRPRYTKHFYTPDFEMAGRVWETKSPVGKSRRTYEDNFRKAMKQSTHIIFDLRRLNTDSEKSCIDVLKKQCATSATRTVLVITRDGRLLTIKGRFDNI